MKTDSCEPIGKPFNNPHLDALVSLKSYQDVWWNLYNNFPLCAWNRTRIDEARKNGTVREVIHRYDVFKCLIKPYGPETKEEWEKLGVACIFAAFHVNVDTEELYKAKKLG